MDRRLRHRALLTAAAVVVSLGGLHAQSPAPSPTATPWVQASPPAAAVKPVPDKGPSPSREDTARAMARKRQEELGRDRTAPAKPQLSPDEREAYERNLNLWHAMPPEEKETIRSLAAERTREEIAAAYESSGLNLNPDQKEVFALRYRQERRRLEREIQQQAKAERARRLPEITERLKREFPAASPAKPTPAPPVTPTK